MTRLILSEAMFERCAAEAEFHEPFETGGVFLGLKDDAGDVRVQHLIGAGPNAIRTRISLEVDDVWQNAQISDLYANGYRGAYVGEWHSHPAARDASLSRRDRAVLAQLAAFSDLRCSDPIMAIFHPAQSGWAAGAWRQDMAQSRRWFSRTAGVGRVSLVVA